MNWQPHKLGEFISIKHGWAFKGEYFSDSGKYILLTPGNAHETGGLKLRPGKEKYYLGEFPPDYLMKTGDMLVVMTDLIQAAPILGGAIVVPEDDRFLHNQHKGDLSSSCIHTIVSHDGIQLACRRDNPCFSLDDPMHFTKGKPASSPIPAS